ncbi:MAG: ATP-binding protein [Tannerellaceae bacterium]|nr:ATP-binding protein [Tannerellaceae bacterium]
MQMLYDLKDQHIIKVITGVRRCGKSTLLQMFADRLIQDGVAQKQVQFYNFEDLDTLAIGDIFKIHTHITKRLVADRMNYLFLDEVQNVSDFQRLVDSLFIKENCDVYVTGSNAYLLSGELATLLTGRYIDINVLPLQFSEYYDFINLKSPNFEKMGSLAVSDRQDVDNDDVSRSKSPNFEKMGSLAVSNRQEIDSDDVAIVKSPNFSKMDTLAIFITEGAIPEYLNQKTVSQKQSDAFVKSVLNTIIEKDIFQRLNIRDRHDFNKIVDFVFDSVGSFVSPRSISDTLRTAGTTIDKETVAKYLDAMCDAFLLYKAPRYEIKGKGLLQTLNKYYLVDPAFRKVRLRRDMKKDITHWLENMVYFELLRRNREVFVGQVNGKEVDFVVTDHDGYISYYQVAWTTMQPETLERELASLIAIKDSNPKYLLTTDIDLNPVYDGIRKLNVVDWMLSN